MFNTINKSEEIKKQLKEKGNHGVYDKPEHRAALEAINENMEKVRREFQIRERESQISAANVVLTS